MHTSIPKVLLVGARGSRLSQVQVQEVESALQKHHPQWRFQPIWIQTRGDRDLVTSLRHLGRTDFFTHEIDELLCKRICRIAIHSAKDLPEPLHPELMLIALTEGLDPRDSLVLRQNETFAELKQGALIGTSSLRREATVKALRPDLQCMDVRGTIEQRLEKLMNYEIDGLIVAECALLRLGLISLNRFFLPGETAQGQGQLAVVARREDLEIQQVFTCIDSRYISV